jgi:hypothetical protein
MPFMFLGPLHRRVFPWYEMVRNRFEVKVSVLLRKREHYVMLLLFLLSRLATTHGSFDNLRAWSDKQLGNCIHLNRCESVEYP